MVCAVGLLACSKAGDESASAKRTPVPPPPKVVAVPGDLSIRVVIDGAPADPITAARLEGLSPDYVDDERRAWRLDKLLPMLSDPKVGIEALGELGVGVVLDRGSAAGPMPVLFLTRRGDVVAALVHEDNPFPDYHGSGGRLRRPGDPLPRISPVHELRLSSTKEGRVPNGGNERLEAATAGLAQLEIVLGTDRAPIGEERAKRVRVIAVDGDDGGSRIGYSLRDIVALTAPGARAVQLTTRSGIEIDLEAGRWDDPQQLPILRSNREGSLKFYWADPTGKALTDEVRDIATVSVSAP